MPEIKQPASNKCAMCGVDRQRLRTIFAYGNLKLRVCGSCYNKYPECSECGTVYIGTSHIHPIHVIPKEAHYLFRGELDRILCRKCLTDIILKYKSKNIKQCRGCDDLFIPSKSEAYCSSCVDRKRVCESCKKVYVNSMWIDAKMNHRNSGSICPECHRKRICKVCCVDIESGKQLCDVCGQHYRICGQCGALLNKETKKCSICEPVVVCDNCGHISEMVGYRYHNHRLQSFKKTCIHCDGSPIMRWDFKRQVKFFGDGALRFGIENEYEFEPNNYMRNTDKLRKWVAERHEFWHLCHDGSLNYGVEMVSQPATFEYMMENLELPPVPNYVDLCSAGCHIHMDKSQFTKLHLFKFIKFLGKNFEVLKHIFGRGVWAKTREIQEGPIRFVNKEIQWHNRYHWINLKNKKTVEIRVFAGTDNISVLKSYIQFLHAAYLFTKNTSIIECLNLDKFIMFIIGKSEYKLLKYRLDATMDSLLRAKYGFSEKAIEDDISMNGINKHFFKIAERLNLLKEI